MLTRIVAFSQNGVNIVQLPGFIPEMDAARLKLDLTRSGKSNAPWGGKGRSRKSHGRIIALHLT